MDEKHINLINEHLEELIEETRDVHKIVDQLLREDVINHYMADIVLKVRIKIKFSLFYLFACLTFYCILELP